MRTLPLLIMLCGTAVAAQDPLCCGRHGQVPWRGADAPPARGFDVKYLRLEWTIDPAQQYITGRVTTWFTATEELAVVRLDAAAALTVTGVDHHQGALAFQQLPGDVLEVALPAPLATGTLDSISITYHGVPDPSGFGSFVTGQYQGGPVQWTLSEPYGAKDWWPCKQDLNDKADSLDMCVTTPVPFRAAGMGLLVDSLTADGWTTWHWRHRRPIAHYLIAVAVADYTVFETTIDLPEGPLPMVTYFYGSDPAAALASADFAAEQMALYRELFGPYPFMGEKYGHARFGWGGGMEHQTMSFMGHWGYELTAHELAHQWFGNKVTCGSWADLWLNEGFATYLSGLCEEHLRPANWAAWKTGLVSQVVSQPGGSLFCADTLDMARLFDGRLTYLKGAMVLHTLRWKVGDAAFFTGCRNYLDDPALAYGSARTSDLQAHLEAASGMDLDGFFADWYMGEGYPSYTATWAQEANGLVSLRLDQATSHPAVPFFALPVPVSFRLGDQDSTVVLHHAHSGQVFHFHLPFQAATAVLDPETWLISAHNVVRKVPVGAFEQDRVLAYPNPAGEQLEVYLGTALHGAVRTTLYDATGRPVRSWPGAVVDDRVTCPLGGLPTGAYTAELRTDDQVLRVRFVKE
ncbi:MAG: M1 family aminopeptidase [Flavobacteriales bacterium]|jgi:aminopeptidase N|nr:M1 family aminopeptidase [Flavobacteriales bacterium]